MEIYSNPIARKIAVPDGVVIRVVKHEPVALQLSVIDGNIIYQRVVHSAEEYLRVCAGVRYFNARGIVVVEDWLSVMATDIGGVYGVVTAPIASI